MNKVLITGASGFIGSHLTELLLSEGFVVLGIYNNRPLHYSHPNLVGLKKNLRDADITYELTKYQPDFLVHAAAINPSVFLDQDKVDFLHFNHVVTMELVDQFLTYAANSSSEREKKLINLSTYEIYGQCESISGHELDAPLNPLTSYAHSKAKTHLAIDAIQNTDSKLINVVCSNNYGPRQSAEKLIPAVVDNLIHQQPINLFGDGSSTRTWTHVEDTCKGLLQIILKGEQKKYHLCSEEHASVEEIVNQLHRKLLYRNIIDTSAPEIRRHTTENNPTFKMNNQTSVNDLKWQAGIDLEAGLSITLDHLLGVQKQCKN